MKIALTYTGNEEKNQYYVDWLQAGEDVDVIKLDAAMDNAAAFSSCDALVLSGGIDIDPALYEGSDNYPAMPEGGWNTARDLFEKELFTTALEQNKPILGICRGMQLINIALGGTLIQHISGSDIAHRGTQDERHQVKVDHGSMLQSIAGGSNNEINSAHHQALDKLGRGLKENCRAHDGIVEGIEWAEPETKPFLLGVQWHPERMFRFSLQHTPLSKNIRNHFIASIKKNAR
jgi:putative glutamine amidotransferase